MSFFTKRFLIALVLITVMMSFIIISTPNGIPVLNYHQINDRDENPLTISPDQFAAQMDWLMANGYHALTQDEFLDAIENGTRLPDRPVLITFDDGYADNYKYAYPILKERNMRATIFVISDYVGLYPNYLTWNEILEMKEHGIEFGSHTLNHAVLTECSRYEAEKQLTNSKAAIEWKTGQEINMLAYPCGFQTKEIQELVKNCGYRAAFTVSLAYDNPEDNMYELHRVPIFGANNHTLLRFKGRLMLPRIAAFLENLQNDIALAGYPRIADLIPVI